MMITSVNNCSNNCRKPQFNGNKTNIPNSVIKKLGINMETRIGYDGKMSYTPAPDTVEPSLKKFLHRMKIDWKKHIDRNTNKTGC